MPVDPSNPEEEYFKREEIERLRRARHETNQKLATEARAKAIVKATTFCKDPAKILEASEELGIGMPGLEISKIPEAEMLQTRGW